MQLTAFFAFLLKVPLLYILSMFKDQLLLIVIIFFGLFAIFILALIGSKTKDAI